MKTAVVLGVSSGVGAAIAEMLAQADYNVVGIHRGHHVAEADALEAKYKNITIERMDGGSSYEEAQEAFNLLEPYMLRESVEVIVHSLSGASLGGALMMIPARVETTFNCLAHSLVWWTRWLKLHDYFASNARVIALSNPCPDFYLRSSGVIGAAKAALESYVKTLAVELKGQPTVNCLRFSTVVTPALEKVMPTAIERLQDLHKAIVPAGRIQTTADVAQLVKMLISPEAQWINGAIIDGTGGAPYMLMDRSFHPNG